MSLLPLSPGHLVLISLSSLVTLSILISSIFDSLWIATFAAALTILLHFFVILQSIRHPPVTRSRPVTNTSSCIASTSLLAIIWVISFAINTNLAISGPSMNMGMMAVSTPTPSNLKFLIIAQAALSALESAILVLIVALSLHEEATKHIPESEKCTSPVSLYA